MKTEAKTAELSKCMENTFRDVNIALANELAKICTKIGVNALDVIEMANKHPRVNGKIAVLGVAYKGNTGDDRESPAYEIIAKLKKDNYEINIWDPHVANDEYVDLNKATKNASLVLILCDHNEFKNLDYDLIKENMKNPIIFDTKNIIKKVPKDIKLYNYGNLFTL